MAEEEDGTQISGEDAEALSCHRNICSFSRCGSRNRHHCSLTSQLQRLHYDAEVFIKQERETAEAVLLVDLTKICVFMVVLYPIHSPLINCFVLCLFCGYVGVSFLLPTIICERLFSEMSK